MKMINNYLNSLETYLPDSLKSDVRDELEASIYAQVEEQNKVLGREINKKEQETILLKIGHPMRVASAYLPNQNLINQDYFPAFKKSLKIALLISFFIKFLFHLPAIISSEHILLNSFSFLKNLVDTALWVFAIVTLIFYLMQKYNASLDEIYAWSPTEIKDSNPKLSINRLETAFETLVILMFIAWWNDLLQWSATANNQNISLSIEWLQVFWSVNIISVVGVIIGLHKLLIAGWNKITLSINVILCIVTFAILFQISNFEQYIIASEQLNNMINGKKAFNILNSIVTYSIYIIAIITAWDLFSSIKKLTKS